MLSAQRPPLDSADCVWRTFNGVARISALRDTTPTLLKALVFDFASADTSDTLRNLVVLLSTMCQQSVTIGATYDAQLRFAPLDKCRPFIKLSLNDVPLDCLGKSRVH
jgi:hypothetical protein